MANAIAKTQPADLIEQAVMEGDRLDDLSIEDLETLASRLESTADKESEG